MATRFSTLEDMVRQGNIAIGNLRSDVELQGPLGEYGYGPARVGQLDAQRQRVDSAIQEYEREASERLGASKARQEARDELLALLRLDRKLAGIRYKRDPQTKALLGLDENLSITYGGLLRQARQLYNAIQGSAQIQAELAESGLAQAKVAERVAAVARLEQADRDYNKEATEAQEARAERDAEVDAFADALADLLDTAEVALAGRPLLLGKLGLA